MGATLSSDLRNGGGTDDTKALQAILDRAEHGAPVHLVIDGAALVTGLNVYSHTIIECINGGGLYLKDGSSRALIRNVHRSRTEIQDERITVRGCFLNGNRAHQPSAAVSGFPSNKEADGTLITGLQFLGATDLNIENVTLWRIRSLGVWVANATRIDIRNVTVDYGIDSDDQREVGQTDGLHFNGPIRYLNIDGVRLRTADDALSFSANDMGVDDMTVNNDMGPYVGQGPITDVTVSNVQLMDSTWGILIQSSQDRIDRLAIRNITGTLRGGYLATISHFTSARRGNIGSIEIEHVDVDRSPAPEVLDTLYKQWSAADPAFSQEVNGGVLPFVSINAAVESLSLQNIQTKVTDSRPILRLGPDARINTMRADVRLYDPSLQATPVVLDEGSRVERLDLSLLWKGETLDRGAAPIRYLGGTVGQLNWINTPPMFVSAQFETGNTLAVEFNQAVKAADFTAGVTVKVNGKPASMANGTRKDDAHVVHYVLKDPIRPTDRIVWSYDATTGNIQNLSGNQLFAVSEQQVASH